MTSDWLTRAAKQYDPRAAEIKREEPCEGDPCSDPKCEGKLMRWPMCFAGDYECLWDSCGCEFDLQCDRCGTEPKR